MCRQIADKTSAGLSGTVLSARPLCAPSAAVQSDACGNDIPFWRCVWPCVFATLCLPVFLHKLLLNVVWFIISMSLGPCKLSVVHSQFVSLIFSKTFCFSHPASSLFMYIS
ncbi:hypothetical protein GOODEAATRI_003413 [Goodea atripinnis]|uniref:Uncharacterized protein n=1 Tax=Goodea atripinnis TaxID=208336 RepID=A0ABV0MP05_9TELE